MATPFRIPQTLFFQRFRLPIAVAGASSSAVLLAGAFLPLGGLVVVVGLLVSLLAGLVIAQSKVPFERHTAFPVELELPFLLASDEVMFLRYRRATEMLLKISRRHDPIYRGIAIDQVFVSFGRLGEERSLLAG